MTKKIELNGNSHEFIFTMTDGKAVNGHFHSDNSQLLQDLVVEYGEDAKLDEIVKKICDSIRIYHVAIDKTSCIEYVYEVYATDEDDAKDEALSGYHDCICTHELHTEYDIVDCIMINEEGEYQC
jgi:hypothetical protein